MHGWITAHLSRDEGATAVEYGIMVALIAAVIIVAVYFIGQELNFTFADVYQALTGDLSGETPPARP
jgi:pilus assembly protein Flp/PilA